MHCLSTKLWSLSGWGWVKLYTFCTILFLATTHFTEILFSLMVPHLISKLLSHLSFYWPLCIPAPPSQGYTNPYTYRHDCLESKHLPWSDPELWTVPWIIVGNQQIVFMLKTYVSNWSKLSGIHPTLHSGTVHATLNPSFLCSVLFTQAKS